jgi:Xaa-Pro aminopeptidase
MADRQPPFDYPRASALMDERVVGVGSVNIEDMVVITAAGCEPLTTFPRDLLVFGQAQ